MTSMMGAVPPFWTQPQLLSSRVVMPPCLLPGEGLSRLVAGMPVKEVISRLEGIRCGGRPTSCPDQLCKALHEMGLEGIRCGGRPTSCPDQLCKALHEMGY